MKTDLKKYYSDLESDKLIELIESDRNINEEIIKICKQLLLQRGLNRSEIKLYAKKFLKDSFFKYYLAGKHWCNTPFDLDSHYLNSKEIEECLREGKLEYENYIKGATRDLPLG